MKTSLLGFIAVSSPFHLGLATLVNHWSFLYQIFKVDFVLKYTKNPPKMVLLDLSAK